MCIRLADSLALAKPGCCREVGQGGTCRYCTGKNYNPAVEYPLAVSVSGRDRGMEIDFQTRSKDIHHANDD